MKNILKYFINKKMHVTLKKNVFTIEPHNIIRVKELDIGCEEDDMNRV